MDNCGNLAGPDEPGWRACSACAGDYEDPDRTAPDRTVGTDDSFEDGDEPDGTGGRKEEGT